MGYQGLYMIRDSKGKSLGKFPGWTAADAIRIAQIKHPDKTDLTAKHTGEENR